MILQIIKLYSKNMNLLKVISLTFLVFSILACGGDTEEIEPEVIINDPQIASLVFPEADSECTEGTGITDTESTITFKWEAALYADSYKLVLKNLRTGVASNHFSNNRTLPLTLKRGTPYSWSVISKSYSSTVTATSTTWKFYNASSGNPSYTPFPAEAISPKNESTITTTNNKVTLDWSGSDVDNDISHYAVYFGETNPPELHQDNVSESIFENIPITQGKTYYWRIITKDTKQNTSSSDLFKFTVK